MDPGDVSEVYSEPRVTARCDKHGLRPGTAMDLATGFNFSEKKDQQRAWKILQKETPHLVMLSPPCTARSKIRAISDFKRDPKVVAAEREACGSIWSSAQTPQNSSIALEEVFCLNGRKEQEKTREMK